MRMGVLGRCDGRRNTVVAQVAAFLLTVAACTRLAVVTKAQTNASAVEASNQVGDRYLEAKFSAA